MIAGRSPLADILALYPAGAPHPAAGVTLAEREIAALVHLACGRREAHCRAALRDGLGLDLPRAPGGTSRADALLALGIAPGRWLIEAPAPGGELIRRLADAAGPSGVVTDVTGGRTAIRLTGPNARVLLSQACPLDLHPAGLPAATCAQTMLAAVPVLLHLLDDTATFDLYVGRSHAAFIWSWLHHAADLLGPPPPR